MSALLKVYTDSGHISEVAHTTQNSTTTAGGVQNIGTTSLQVVSTANMPAQGVVDIDTAGNLETIAYTAILDATHLTLAKATAISHASGVAVVQWYYNLVIGDQTNGILNDGSQATPTGLNTATWYLYNAGDQTALNISLSVSSVVPPATADGVADTLVSVTSSGAGFASSVSPTNLAVGAVQQFWIVEEIPLGQGNTPGTQVGVPTIIYQSV
jgi:hypothetical protein